MTVKAPGISPSRSRITLETTRAFASGDKPAKRMSTTPAVTVSLAKHYLPKVFVRREQQVSALICLSRTLYQAVGAISATATTSWPSSKTNDNRMVHTLICEKIHAPGFCMG
jgi:hypothetical protein